MDVVLIERDKKKVKIEKDEYGLTLLTMMNGFQWWGNSVDDELLLMIRDAIGRYFVECGQERGSVEKAKNV